MASLIAPLFNFSILVIFLAVKLYKPTQSFVSNRQKTIRETLQSVRAQLSLAQEKYDEFSSKLKAIDSEIVSLREQTRQESSAMKQKVLAETKRLTQTMLADATRTAETLYSDFKNEVSSEFSIRALDRAEIIIQQQLNSGDRTRMQQEFASQVGSYHS